MRSIERDTLRRMALSADAGDVAFARKTEHNQAASTGTKDVKGGRRISFL